MQHTRLQIVGLRVELLGALSIARPAGLVELGLDDARGDAAHTQIDLACSRLHVGTRHDVVPIAHPRLSLPRLLIPVDLRPELGEPCCCDMPLQSYVTILQSMLYRRICTSRYSTSCRKPSVSARSANFVAE